MWWAGAAGALAHQLAQEASTARLLLWCRTPSDLLGGIGTGGLRRRLPVIEISRGTWRPGGPAATASPCVLLRLELSGEAGVVIDHRAGSAARGSSRVVWVI